MSFAQIEFEVMQELDGIRLQLFIAVRHEEFLDGVCKLSPTEISRKYNKLHNESNTSRIRKKMISDGWLIEVVGGIVTKKFNTTANFAVNEGESESGELQKMQLTAKNAVIELNEAAKNAGTEIALKDLEFKNIKLQEKDISIDISKKKNFSKSQKADRIFEFWQKRMNSKRAKFTKDRKTKIENILKDFSYSDCLRAIIGCYSSNWHMGRAPNNQTPYNEFERIFKKPEETEKFINFYFKQVFSNKSVATSEETNGSHQRSNQSNFDKPPKRTNADVLRDAANFYEKYPA